MERPERQRFDYTEMYEVLGALDEQELWPYAPSAPEAAKRNRWLQARHAVEKHYTEAAGREFFACPASSGTAAVHIALAGLRIPAGTEVITTPMTDMGTVAPVIFQNLIPVFADLDPETGLITDKTIAAVATPRTRAVIVVHLAGSPADMDGINAFCRPRGIKVIEDAAQAHGATYKGQLAGSLGDAGCFSLNGQKQITTGEGGLVLLDDPETFRRCLSFSDKHRRRLAPSTPEHETYAGSGLNYRMSDLDFAILMAQWKKLPEIAARFNALGRYFDERLAAIPGVTPQAHHPEAEPTFFTYLFRLDPGLAERRDAVREAMQAAARTVGMRARGPYGRAPLYSFPVFQNKNFFDTIGEPENANPVWPAELVARHHFSDVTDADFSYRNLDRPVTDMWYRTSLSIGFHDGHDRTHADVMIDAIRGALT